MGTLKKLHVEPVIAGVALLVSLVALYFSWQANRLLQEQNEIALQANTPTIRVVNSSDPISIDLFPCTAADGKTDIILKMHNSITLYNSGGRSTSLTDFNFRVHNFISQNYLQWWFVGVKKPADVSTSLAAVQLPLEIGDGGTQPLVLETSTYLEFNTDNGAKDWFRTLPQASSNPTIDWSLNFADGSSVTLLSAGKYSPTNEPNYTSSCQGEF